jgi:hypothetical protein
MYFRTFSNGTPVKLDFSTTWAVSKRHLISTSLSRRRSVDAGRWHGAARVRCVDVHALQVSTMPADRCICMFWDLPLAAFTVQRG